MSTGIIFANVLESRHKLVGTSKYIPHVRVARPPRKKEYPSVYHSIEHGKGIVAEAPNRKMAARLLNLGVAAMQDVVAKRNTSMADPNAALLRSAIAVYMREQADVSSGAAIVEVGVAEVEDESADYSVEITSSQNAETTPDAEVCRDFSVADGQKLGLTRA